MTKQLDVACFGHISLDTRCRIQSYPLPNRGTHIQQEIIALGGDAAIISSNLSLWGYRVGLIGNGLGKDEISSQIIDLLTEANVEFQPKYIYESSSHIIVFVSPDGSRTWFACGIDRFRSEESPKYDFEMIARSKIAYIDSWFGKPALQAISYANRFGKPIVLQSGPWTPRNILSGVWVTVHSISDYENADPGDLIQEDLNDGVTLSVITLGASGCIFGTGRKIISTPGNQVNVVDATGAGATFTSGIIHGLLMELELEQLPALANRIAGYKVSKLGNLSKTDIPLITQIAKQWV